MGFFDSDVTYGDAYNLPTDYRSGLKDILGEAKKLYEAQMNRRGDIITGITGVQSEYDIGMAKANKKTATEKINSITAAFSKDERFESVKIVEMALDMRPEKYIEDETGSGHVSISEDAKDGFFEIEMTMKGRST